MQHIFGQNSREFFIGFIGTSPYPSEKNLIKLKEWNMEKGDSKEGKSITSKEEVYEYNKKPDRMASQIKKTDKNIAVKKISEEKKLSLDGHVIKEADVRTSFKVAL